MLLVGIYTLSWMGPESFDSLAEVACLPAGRLVRSGAFQDDKESVEETPLSEAAATGGGSSLYRLNVQVSFADVPASNGHGRLADFNSGRIVQCQRNAAPRQCGDVIVAI
jgi:hypothetical protein